MIQSRRTVFAMMSVLACALTTSMAQGQCAPAWVPGLGTPGVSDEVRAMLVLPFGDVIIGGHVFMAGGEPVSNIAFHDQVDNSWSALGGGTNGPVNALARVAGGSVIVGGQFNIAGGVSGCNNIARLNPATGQWQSLGGGTNGPVNMIAEIPWAGNSIIVGGSFTMAGGAPASSVARYDLSTGAWTPLSMQVDGDIHCGIVLPFGDVIIGGHVLTAGGAPAGNIIRYNLLNDTWSTLGAGTNGDVNGLTLLPDGDVLVLGNFTSAGGMAARSIARYSPGSNAWSQVPIQTVDSDLHLGLVLPFGDVIIGGHVRITAGGPVSNIVRFDPITNALSTLGAGTNGDVNALALLPDGNVLVGGAFTAAGGVASNRLAHYFPGATPAAIELHPVTSMVCRSQNATFSVTAAGTGPLTYQWQWRSAPGRAWIGLEEGLNQDPGFGQVQVQGTNTIPLTVHAHGTGGNFRVVVTNICNSVTSNPANLSICAADFNCDQGVDFFDYLDFVDEFSSQSPAADFNGDSSIDFFDYLDFVDEFSIGC